MQELPFRQIDEAIRGAVEKNIPLSVAYFEDRWFTLHSRFQVLQGEHILLAIPIDQDDRPHAFQAADKIGLNFKLKHHKYTGSSRVVGIVDDAQGQPCLAVCFPTHMHRLQRRSFSRVEVPAGRIVRVSVWQGSSKTEPAGPGSEDLVLSGAVLDFSAGGFRLQLSEGQQPPWLTGQPVGVRMLFGPGEKRITADAVFRHVQSEPGAGISLGFQFVGLAQSSSGRDAMRIISQKMGEFSQGSSSSRRRRSAS